MYWYCSYPCPGSPCWIRKLLRVASHHKMWGFTSVSGNRSPPLGIGMPVYRTAKSVNPPLAIAIPWCCEARAHAHSIQCSYITFDLATLLLVSALERHVWSLLGYSSFTEVAVSFSSSFLSQKSYATNVDGCVSDRVQCSSAPAST